MELITPAGMFDRFFRWCGIVKSINVFNGSRCNIIVDRKVKIEPNESARVPIKYNKITIYMFLDHKWYPLYKNDYIDKSYDMVIDNRHINFVDRLKV